MTLSGDKAFELFVSSEPFPLLAFLDAWREGVVKAEAGYVLAVIGAYQGMVKNCRDGRYQGVIRNG